MSEYRENIGHREELRRKRQRIVAEITSHRDSIRAALPVVGEVQEITGEYVVQLAASLHEALVELKGVDNKIHILNSQLGE